MTTKALNAVQENADKLLSFPERLLASQTTEKLLNSSGNIGNDTKVKYNIPYLKI